MVNFEQSPKGKQGTNKSRDDDAQEEEEYEKRKVRKRMMAIILRDLVRRNEGRSCKQCNLC